MIRLDPNIITVSLRDAKKFGVSGSICPDELSGNDERDDWQETHADHDPEYWLFGEAHEKCALSWGNTPCNPHGVMEDAEDIRP